MRAFEFITEGRPPFSPTPEQQQEIADLYASGFSGADIAKEYKVSKDTISKFIRNLPNFKELRQQFYKARAEQGLSTGAKGITTDQIQQIANNFAFGKNFDQLSKEFGITSNNILKMLSRLSNYEELKQQNTKARKDQGLLSIEDLGNKGITSAQVDQMAKEYAKGETFKNVGKMFNINTSGAMVHLTKRPDWEEIKFQNRTNRSRKLGGTQSLTNRGINKPGSKGIHAIRRTGSPSGSVFEGEIMRLHEFIYEEVGRVLDLTKNYPHYSILKGKILDISPKGKYKIQIVNAEIIPGKKVSVKVGDTVVIGANFLKQALKESELEEGWKGAAKGLAAAGALALAGHTFLPDPGKPAPTPRPISKQLPKVDSEITQRVNALINNPAAKALRREAAIAGIEGAELAQLIAQCAHETQNFTSLKEFGGPTYFRRYDIQYDPQKAKMLGNTEPGDGARYRGRGYIQLTGRYNYRKAGEALGLPLEDQPELLERPDIAAKATLWYWQTRVQPKVSNFKDTREVTKPINSGLRGLSDREEKFNAIMQFYNQPAFG